MELYCVRCETKVEIVILLSGPHLKALCAKCRNYIKFLNKTERKQLEDEEDA